MAPFYRGYEPKIRLDNDDIEGIQALYGEKEENIKSVNQIPEGAKPSSKGIDNKVSQINLLRMVMDSGTKTYY